MTSILLPSPAGRGFLLGLLAAAAFTAGACTDRGPTEVLAPHQPRLESAPMPANAVLLDLEDLDYPYNFATWLMRAGTNPRVEFVNFYRTNSSYVGSDGQVGVVPYTTEGVVSTMHFSKPLARLQLYIYGIHGVTIKCYDRVGREVAAGEIPDVVWGAEGWKTLDLQGDGILSCTMAGYGVLDSIRLLPMPQNQLKLTCTGDLGENRVTRGERIQCVAKKDPETAAGELTITSWSFEGEPRVDTPVDAATWAGPMVRSGTVTVKARIGTGTEMTAVAPITVVARDWSEKTISLTPERVRNGDSKLSPLPPAVLWAHDLGHARFVRENGQPEMIDEGPNRDYSYIPDLLVRYTQYYAVNDDALAPNSAFTRAQAPTTNSAGGIRLGGRNYCQQRDVPRQDARIEQHELVHGTMFRDKLVELLKPELAKLEALVGRSDSEVTDPLDQALERLEKSARDISAAIVDDKKGPYASSFVDSNGRACLMKNVEGADLDNKPTPAT
jgi:hypothetical protein